MADAHQSPAAVGHTTGRPATADPRQPRAQPPPVIQLSGSGTAAGRRSRYVAGSTGHRGQLPADLAAALVHEYTQPGDLVLDPFAGVGTTLVEAVHAGRDAIGVEYEAGWTALARANLALARRQGAAGHARILCRDATRLPQGVPRHLQGRVQLVLTAPPDRRTMLGRTTKANGHRTSGTHATRVMAARHAAGQRIERISGLSTTLAGCVPLLTYDALLLAVTRQHRYNGHVDISGQTLQAGLLAGLQLIAVRHAVPACRFGAGSGNRRIFGQRAARVKAYTIAVFRTPTDRRH